jgi:hypothetical protein
VQPDRVLADEPANVGIVIAERVVVQPGFRVVILALEAQVLVAALDAVGPFLVAVPFFEREVAPGLVAGAPLTSVWT